MFLKGRDFLKNFNLAPKLPNSQTPPSNIIFGFIRKMDDVPQGPGVFLPDTEKLSTRKFK